MELDQKIVKVLYDRQLVKKSDLVNVFKIQKANNDPLEKLLVKLKVLDRKTVLDVKAKLLNAEPYLIDNSKINRDVAGNIPQAMAKRYNLICPDQTSDGRMIIAMHNPSDSFALEYVQMRTGKAVKPYAALLADLEDAWEIIYAQESKKKHPFFRKQGSEPAFTKKAIPDKFMLPGFSKKTSVITENKEKVEEDIKQATDSMREASGDSSADIIRKELEVLSILSRSGSLLNSELDEDEIITKILKIGTEICTAQGGSILILEEEKQFLYFKEAISPKRSQLLKVKIPVSEKSIAGWVVINRKPVAANNLEQDPRHYKEIDRFIDFETNNIACVPLVWGESILGVMEMVNKTDGHFDERDLEYLSILATQASVALHNFALMEQFKNFYMEVVEILIDCLEIMNPISRDHSLQVARLASAMAKTMNLSQDEYENICYAAFLHDIGKMKVDDQTMENHPVEGAQMISHINFFRSIAPMIRHHHEHYDGSGYPDRLTGESIPVGARILAVAEGFLEERANKPDLSDEEYFEDFLNKFGTLYDPVLKIVFQTIMNKEPKQD